MPNSDLANVLINVLIHQNLVDNKQGFFCSSCLRYRSYIYERLYSMTSVKTGRDVCLCRECRDALLESGDIIYTPGLLYDEDDDD